MEHRIGKIPGIRYAAITYATQRLDIEADDPDSLLPQIQAACDSVDEGVVISVWKSGRTHPHADSHAEHTDESSAPRVSSFLHEHRVEVRQILCSAVLLAAAVVLSLLRLKIPSVVLYLAAYLFAGLPVLITAFKNIRKGQVFDENFLMMIASIGALVIGEYPEAVGVMLFYRVGELFEEAAVERSRSHIMDAVDMRPEVVRKVHEDHVHTIPAGEAVIGDVLQIRPGDRIPLDGTVTQGESLLDTSPITGEPVPMAVRPGSAVLSGCVNQQGLLQIRVEKPLEESMVTRILDSVENAAASKPKMERFISRFARIYTPIVVLVAVAAAVLPSLITGNWMYWLKTACTFLVISCPCALVLSVPLAFFAGIGAGSRKGILFKGGLSLEAVEKTKILVMDKTGTLTEGNFVLQEVLPVSKDADESVRNRLLQLCAGAEAHSTHPIAQSILQAADERKLSVPEALRTQEIAGKGILAEFPEGTVLCGSRKLMDDCGIVIPVIDGRSFGTEVYTALDGKLLGLLIISDTLKKDAPGAVSTVSSQGIRTAMLTGDTEESAEAVAKAAGLDHVHARLLPQDKLAHLQKLRAQYGPVMYVGDGINDAPVLAGADAGCAMGSGADAAIEAADVVFMTSRMDAVPEAISIARRSGRIARGNVIFALAVKLLIMILGLAGHANMWMAVFADTGVLVLCILNSLRILYSRKYR